MRSLLFYLVVLFIQSVISVENVDISNLAYNYVVKFQIDGKNYSNIVSLFLILILIFVLQRLYRNLG
jgi:uncharacterized integral membrane protein